MNENLSSELTPREQRAARTRQAICDAALAIFRRSGYAAVSMRAVAKEMGGSTMSTYNYYSSKDDLFLDVRSRLFRQLTDYLTARVTSNEPRERVKQTCSAYLSYGLANGPEYSLLFDDWNFENYHEMLERFGAARFKDTVPFNILRDNVALHLRDIGSHKDPQIVAHLAWVQVHGLLDLHHAHKFAFGISIEQLLEPSLDWILDALD